MSEFNVPLIKTVDESYKIIIGQNLYAELVEHLQTETWAKIYRFAIIADDSVAKLFGENLKALMTNAGLNTSLFTFPAGEKSKVRKTKSILEDQMIEAGFGRDSAIIALGGGVVTDLAGFLAATYGRGIPYINYATTVLCAADSCVGGKTAVDHKAATNLIGAFHQPARVYIDLETWKTLSVRQVISGMAETVKHACMADKEFFTYLEKNIPKILPKNGEEFIMDEEICTYIAHKNCEIKYNVVVKDEKESNLRQILNLGHTAGRALETVCDYTLTHGEAVAIGTVIQAKLGKALGFLSEENLKQIISLTELCGLPTEIPSKIPLKLVVEKMHTDKKSRKGEIYFVFQNGIGEMKQFENGNYAKKLTDEFILETLS